MQFTIKSTWSLVAGGWLSGGRQLLPFGPSLNNKGAQLDLTLAQSHRSPSQNGFCRRRMSSRRSSLDGLNFCAAAVAVAVAETEMEAQRTR